MKSNKIFIILLGLVFLILILFTTPLGKEMYQTIFPTKTDNKTMSTTLNEEDFLMELGGINQPSINLNQLKGKVLFINFWGTWCAPCRFEMPSIQQLYNKHKNSVAFVTIALPARGEEVKQAVIDYLNQNNYSLPAYELHSMPSHTFDSNVVPMTLIIDKKGNIVYRLDGAKDWDDKETNQLLTKLTNE